MRPSRRRGLVVGVLTGTHPAARLRQAGATHVLASVADLPAILAGAAEPGLAASHVTAPRQAPEDSVPEPETAGQRPRPTAPSRPSGRPGRRCR